MDIVAVDHPGNPFRNPGVGLHNAILFGLLRHTGMRRGELLSLCYSDIDVGHEPIVWVRRNHDDVADPRRHQPVAKTKERPLPIPMELASQTQDYFLNHRSKTPVVREHGFLLVSHKKGVTFGQPLSQTALGSQIMAKMRSLDPAFVDIHPHSFRHHFNYMLSKRVDEHNARVRGQQEVRAFYPLGGVSHQGYATVQGLFRVATIDKPCGECDQPYASRTYDVNSRPASYTDFNGSVRAMTYDANGLPTQEIDAKGSADQRTIDTTWNTVLRVPLLRTVKDASGHLVQKEGWAFSSRGQTTAQCLIDPVKAPSYTCAATGTVPTGVRRTSLTYCESVSTTCPLLGLLLTVDGPRTDVSDTLTYA